jgi:radical SAM protein with 4Fe4S-binding SPASM domain
LPSVVEVSESGTCNRKCSFCPRSAPDFLDVKKFVSEDLINKLSKELSIYDYSGLFLFSGFVEPMVDKNIYFLILIVRNNLPKARIEMITNGDALNKQRVKKLFKSGLSTLLVSIYDGKKEAEEMEKLLQNSGLSEDQFKVRHRYLPENESFGITLSNRAGMMDKAEYIIPSLKEPMKKPCYYPHYTFFMDYAGEVLICSHDWKKKLIVGNLNNETFIDIWLNQKFNLARKNLYNANRNFAPCNKCDVTGTFMGSIHAKAWNKI